jgi:hypothetical protein
VSGNLSPGQLAAFAAAAAKARAQRGAWFHLAHYMSVRGARSVAGRITSGRNEAFPHAGDWEAYTAACSAGVSVWLRYVGGTPPVPAWPDRMTVRVPHRSETPEGMAVGVLTVSVSTRCPRCGGPRGIRTVRPYTFRHGDVSLQAERWTNPCGHKDEAEDVVWESRVGQVDDPASLVQAAYAAQGIDTRATQAMHLLRGHGHEDAAAVLYGEIKNNNTLTTAQAVTFLRGLTGGGR